MMKRLKLDEGEPIRLTGTTLPKGKLVKIQAQTPDFVEVSDPKAVCVWGVGISVVETEAWIMVN